MEDLLRAIEMEDTETIAKILYGRIDEIEEKKLSEVLKKVAEVAFKKRDWELFKLSAYYEHEILGDNSLIKEFEELAEKDGFETNFHLADLYFMIGEVEKSLELYRELLEEETVKGNLDNVAEVYYSMALVYEELQDYEKAYELIEKAEEYFFNAKNESRLKETKVYKAYLKFEMGRSYEAKAELAGVIPEVLDDNLLLTEIHLAFEEIFEEDENYEAALQECLYAMIRSRKTDFENVAFNALVDLLWEFFLDGEFETVYNNIPMFEKALPEMAPFFEAVKVLALWRDGKAEEEEFKEALKKVKDERLLEVLRFLSEAEV